MKIRAMQLKDMEEVVGMMRVFYDSPAVIHAAPDEILRQDVKDCVGDCPYIEGYIFEENDRSLDTVWWRKAILRNMVVYVSGWKIFT